MSNHSLIQKGKNFDKEREYQKKLKKKLRLKALERRRRFIKNKKRM